VSEISGLHHCQHRAKNFFHCETMVRLNPAEDRRTDEETVSGRLLLEDAFALAFADAEILHDLRMRCSIDDRTDEVARIFGRADLETARCFHQTLEHYVVNFFEQNQTRRRGALLP